MTNAAAVDSLTGLRPDESIYVGQNALDRHRTELLAADFAGHGPGTGRLDCILARRRGPGSEEWLVHERWHDERFIHGEFATALPGPHDRLVAVGDHATVVDVS